MPTKLYKILLVLGIVFVLISIPVFLLAYSVPGNLEVDFLDVGQGDAILIKVPSGQNILIDGGPNSEVISCLSEELSWWDRTIDLMILSHPHDDHVSGLIEVIRRYEVKKIIYTGVPHNSPSFLTWLNLIKEKKIPMIIVDREQKINLGPDCFLEFLYPNKAIFGRQADNLNNTSIINKLTYKNNKFLFMGDAEMELEEILLNGDFDLSANILKIGHHGSDTSSSEEFLRAVKPEFAIIEVGEDNKFSHPSLRVLKRLERMNIKAYRTELDGTIRIISDGNSFEFINY